MKVTFACPACEQPDAVPLDSACDWQCSACDHRQHLAAIDPTLPDCVVCGCHDFYKQKDFPHTLGMVILVGALLLSTITYYWYEKWWTWSFLIGSAIIDGALYLLVGDVVVCYRCSAHYRGLATSVVEHQPFEITIGERYRQERIRQDRLKGR